MKKPYEKPESEDLKLGPYEDICINLTNPTTPDPNEPIGDDGDQDW